MPEVTGGRNLANVFKCEVLDLTLRGWRAYVVQYFAFSFEAEGIQHLRDGATSKRQQRVRGTLCSPTPTLFRVLPYLKDSPTYV